MQKLKIYQADAFADKLFGGNPAAVVPLQSWLSDDILQKIAAENNLAETAYYLPSGEDFALRWFTPGVEVKLCGHATLAAAHIIFTETDYGKNAVNFQTKSGTLTVEKDENGYRMDFPADKIERIENPPAGIEKGLGTKIKEVWKGDTDYMVVLDNEAAVRDLKPDFRALNTYSARGTIVTAPGEETDFISRCFYPQAGIDEDPTTGSAHTTMTPYWANRLGKNKLTARQISRRIGNLLCELKGERVLLSGQAVTYLRGEIWV